MCNKAVDKRVIRHEQVCNSLQVSRVGVGHSSCCSEGHGRNFPAFHCNLPDSYHWRSSMGLYCDDHLIEKDQERETETEMVIQIHKQGVMEFLQEEYVDIICMFYMCMCVWYLA